MLQRGEILQLRSGVSLSSVCVGFSAQLCRLLCVPEPLYLLALNNVTRAGQLMDSPWSVQTWPTILT